jgi:hypothetical protein
MGDPAQPQALLYTAWKLRDVPGLAEVGWARGSDDEVFWIWIGLDWIGGDGGVNAVSWKQSRRALRIFL